MATPPFDSRTTECVRKSMGAWMCSHPPVYPVIFSIWVWVSNVNNVVESRSSSSWCLNPPRAGTRRRAPAVHPHVQLWPRLTPLTAPHPLSPPSSSVPLRPHSVPRRRMSFGIPRRALIPLRCSPDTSHSPPSSELEALGIF